MTSFSEFLQQSYARLGAFDANFVYLYSDFRHFVQYVAELGGRDNFCSTVIAPFLDRGQTVVMTAFSYTTQGRFDVLSTPTKVGALNKWFLRQEGVQRSEHPLFSYAAMGPNAGFLTGIGKSAFGHDSVFDRLKGRDAVFVHVGRPIALGNTALHHVEHVCGATYRVHKAFQTKIYRGEAYLGTDYTAFLRRRDVEGASFGFDFTRAAQALINAGLVRSTGSDEVFSTISCYRYDTALAFLYDLFYQDPRMFIKTDFIQY